MGAIPEEAWIDRGPEAERPWRGSGATAVRIQWAPGGVDRPEGLPEKRRARCAQRGCHIAQVGERWVGEDGGEGTKPGGLQGWGRG